MEESLVSVIVAVYNVESYLDKCMESICSQTYRNLEIILMNDGSRDNSGIICDAWTQRDARVKVCHKKNSGVSDTRNQGISMSCGDYIVFVDSDDYLEPDYIECMVEQMQEGVLPVTGYYIEIESEGRNKMTPRVLDKEPVKYLKGNQILTVYQAGMLNAPWNKLYDARQLKEKKIFFDTQINLGEDILFNLTYLKESQADFCIVNKPVYHYMRRGTESLDNKYRKDFFEHQVMIFESMIAYAMQAKAEQADILQLYSYYFNALVVAIDNLYCNRKTVGKQTYKERYKSLINRLEFRQIIDRMQGKMRFVYQLRFWGIGHGLYVIDYMLREGIKRLIGRK